MQVRVGLGQIDPIVGDLEGNVARCEEAVRLAAASTADVVVLPEMAVPGYPPRDMLFDETFVVAVGEATQDLARRLADLPTTVVGTVLPAASSTPGHPGLHNAAVVLAGGEIQTVVAKRLLPGYDVFYEPRWFVPGEPSSPVEIAGVKVGILICEDLWDEGYPVHPAAELVARGAEALLSISASPYRQGVLFERRRHALRAGVPVVYVNACGAQDELIFDGRSFVVGASGEVLVELAAFTDEVRVVDLSADAEPLAEMPVEEELFRALTLGITDFAAKNRLERAVLGLSGGIDSALVAALATAALGPDRVTALAIPSRFSDPRSTSTAEELARTLGITFEVVPLEELHLAAESTLESMLEGGTTAENLQARLRAMILMAQVNHGGGMLLNTSNKTELALGYATLYGDMAGSLCPIADLTKPQVQALAGWVNDNRWPIPEFIRSREPSAELEADQVDPFDYAVIGPRMEALVQANQSNRALLTSEHKRRQMGVVLKVSEKSFGTGRMIPITRR